MTAGRLLAAIAVAAAIPAYVRAEQPLTIDDAVREAIDHNLTLAAERYSVSVARARVVTAGLRPNPVFTYNAMLPDRTIFDQNVNPVEHVVRADVVVEGGGKRGRRIEAAEQAVSVAELQLVNTMRTIVLDVQNAFTDVLLARANLALARDSLAAFDAVVNVNVERVRAGDLAPAELSRSQLAALQFRNDVRQQESKLAIAVNRLKTLLGRTAPGPLDVVGELGRDHTPIAVEDIRRLALERRPDLEAARRDQARSSADLRLQIAQGKIDYTISGEYHRQTAPKDVAGNQYGVYLSVPVPIFNRNQGEVARARQEEQQAAARVKALEAEVLNDVEAAYQQYSAARDVLCTIEAQMLQRARDVREATEYAYRRGEASFVEFLDAVRAFNDTMQSYNEARADFARSLYTIDSITGKVNP